MKINEDMSVTLDYNETLMYCRMAHYRVKRAKRILAAHLLAFGGQMTNPDAYCKVPAYYEDIWNDEEKKLHIDNLKKALAWKLRKINFCKMIIKDGEPADRLYELVFRNRRLRK